MEILRVLMFRLAAVFLCAQYCHGKTVTLDFNATWVNANPDGLHERKVVGINGQWPLPVIEVDKGDRLIVNMFNGLGDKHTSIHWHGMFQNGTNNMDGPSMVTQCPIAPGSSMTYNFTVPQNGTYWYHCHTDACYPDGYRQALIVHDNQSYFNDMYDHDLTITLSDWYHELIEDIPFIRVENPTGAEPVPNSFLFNDTLNTNIAVEAGKTYLMRLINIGAFVAQYFYIEDHTFRIVEIDGVYVDEQEADTLYIAAAQRYSILVTMKNSTTQNYPIVTVADSVLLDVIDPSLQLNQTNWLEYNSSAAHPQAVMKVDVASDLVPYDDLKLVPHDRMPLLPDPDMTIEVDVIMDNLANGAGYAFFNNISYTKPKVPTLYSVLSSGNYSTNSEIYGEFTHPFVLEHNQVIEVILNNQDTGSHPFHLHGHNFQMVSRTPSYGPNFYDFADGDPVAYNATENPSSSFPAYPARRDTFVAPPQGNFVVRFVADNPGVWLFHCHIDWHLMQGLAMSFVEAPKQIQEQMSLTDSQVNVCKAADVAYEGNAAGNTDDLLDLTGQNRQLPWLPAGFTTKGIVAMVFSCVSAFLGMAFITVYGISGIQSKKEETSQATEGNES
ncbi:Multicopper oxidase type 2 [Penicillium cosmopolitanum]|uniref:Multicopper oxidase type 2 n=1 Tax=Penicillium cosmopolitanum TaxID=1131564 RepID=A0A9W9RZW8_9EURO|nr:Multicopper oxidase type 2 [Penicillium cosmopolitanum]KAJ5369472.1 Multicopper oxidase type 2 [Penicillium cosmopolitanum]